MSGFTLRGPSTEERGTENWSVFNSTTTISWPNGFPAYEISPTDICSTTPTSTPKKNGRPRRPTTRFGRFGRVGNALNVRLDGPRGSHITWFIHDPVDGNDWSSKQLDAIQRLLPHIRQTVTVQQVLANAAALGASMGAMLEATGVGVLQLDARRILVANERARDLLRTCDGLLDRGGFLFASTAPDNDDLQRLLSGALPPFGALGAGGSMMVRRSGALPPLVLHVNALGSSEADSRMWPVAALVLAVDPAGGVRVDPDAVAASLGLTRMESRVVVLLAGGMKVREIASAACRRGVGARDTH